jgi:protein O-mannosyl-transferase
MTKTSGKPGGEECRLGLALLDRQAVLIGLGLALGAVLLFARCLGAGFLLYDDPDYASSNPWVKQGLTWSGIVWSWTAFEAANWHPLVWQSLMLDTTLFGQQPWGYHLSNCLQHAANTVLLFLAFRELTGEVARPALLAVWFAVHPCHVESVAWISERKDTLSAMFWMGCLWSYGVARRRGSRAALWACLLLLALGLCAKQMLVTLPCVLVLLDVWPLNRWSGTLIGRDDTGSEGRRSLGALLLEKWPQFVVVLLACIAVLQAQISAGAVSTLVGIPLPDRLRTAITGYGMYLVHAMWPIPLTIFYPYYHTHFGWSGVLASIGTIGSLLIAGVRLFPMNRAVVIGLLWYLGTLVPVIGLVQVGQQSLADRYTYVPFIGLGIAMIWLLPESPWVMGRLRREWIGAGVVAGVLSAITVWQTGFWVNNETLFRRSLEVTTGNYVAHFMIGETLRIRGDKPEAMEHFRRAAELDKISISGATSLVMLGRDHELRGEVEVAEAMYRQALEQVPVLATAMEGLGALLIRKNQLDDGLALLERAIELEPRFFAARYSLGLAYLLKGELQKAEREISAVVEIKPEFQPAQEMLAEIRRAMQRPPQAEPKRQPTPQ